MAAAQRDIEITRGDGYRHKVEFMQPVSPGSTELEVIDVSDWVVEAAVADWWKDATATELFEVDEAASDRAQGIVWIFLTPAQTENEELPERSVWDVQYTTGDPGAEPDTFLRGNVRLKGQATP